MSVDPLYDDYPFYTPYQFAGNKPIWAIDIDGLEEAYATEVLYKGKYTVFYRVNEDKEVRERDKGKIMYIYIDGTKSDVKPMNKKDMGII